MHTISYLTNILRILSRAVVTMAVLHTSTAARGEPSKPDDILKHVDALFEADNRAELPGYAVAIIREGNLIYSKGFGSSNLDTETPITASTIFETASFTKSFTCVCLALLMDEGKLSPDDDIRKYLPEMHAFDPPITVRDLMRCHSGLRDYYFMMQYSGWPLKPSSVSYTPRDVLNILFRQRTLQFPTGSKFGYSNSDYVLLGQIVERISGMPLEDFARKNIFAPLEMNRTKYAQPGNVIKGRAVGYEFSQAKIGDREPWLSQGPVMGAMGVCSCIEDLHRWDNNFRENKLVKGKYVDSFFRDGALLDNRFCLDVDAAIKKNNPTDEQEAMHRGVKRIQFTGGGFGFASAMSRFPDHGLTIICLENNGEYGKRSPWKMTKRIAQLFLADVLEPEDKNVKNSRDEDVEQLSPQVIEGDYIDDSKRIFKISHRNDSLHLTNSHHATVKLLNFGGNRFQPAIYPWSLTLQFSRETPNAPCLLKCEGDYGTREFEPLKMAPLKREEMQKYIGEFFSKELMAIYRFRVHENVLWLQIQNHAWQKLRHIGNGQFIPFEHDSYAPFVVEFQQEKDESADAFTIGFGRARGVVCNRIDKQSSN